MAGTKQTVIIMKMQVSSATPQSFKVTRSGLVVVVTLPRVELKSSMMANGGPFVLMDGE